MRFGIAATVITCVYLFLLIIGTVGWAFDLPPGVLFVLGIPLLLVIVVLASKILPENFTAEAFAQAPKVTAQRAAFLVLLVVLWVGLYAYLFATTSLQTWRAVVISIPIFGFLIYVIDLLEKRWSRGE